MLAACWAFDPRERSREPIGGGMRRRDKIADVKPARSQPISRCRSREGAGSFFFFFFSTSASKFEAQARASVSCTSDGLVIRKPGFESLPEIFRLKPERNFIHNMRYFSSYTEEPRGSFSPIRNFLLRGFAMLGGISGPP